MNKRVRGAASLSPSRDATHEAQNPASRIWSGAHPGRKRSVRKTCGATKSSGVRMAIVPKKAAVRMSALFLPRAYHASPVFPSSNRAAVAVNSDTPSRMHASRIHGCSMNMRICTNCAAAHTQRAANSGNNTSVTSPNEQCEQHTADGKRVLSGTPEMRAAQYKSQRGRGKAQNRTHDAHGRLLSGGIPHLIRCGMICRDRRHVSRLSPQALGLQRAIFLDINAFSPKHPVAGAPPFPLPLRPLTNVIRNGLFLPAALSTGK